MEDFDSIFGPPDSDQDLANASAILSKIAADVGVDLNKLSEEDLVELLGDLMPANPTTATTTKEAQMPQTETKITNTDVALELSKIASAHDIDINTVSREEYAEAFDKLAQQMVDDPEYFTNKVAEEAKLAEAYNQGVSMADGFLARIKQAEEEAEKEEKKDKKEEEKEKEASKGSDIVHVGSAARTGAKRVLDTARYHGDRMIDAVRDHGAKHKGKYTHGAAAAGGAAAGGAAGYAAGSRKKEASDELVNKIAADILRDAGFDPATGEKTAQADKETLALTALAFQKIAEAGYLAE